jgi:hypothetical protein
MNVCDELTGDIPNKVVLSPVTVASLFEASRLSSNIVAAKV